MEQQFLSSFKYYSKYSTEIKIRNLRLNNKDMVDTDMAETASENVYINLHFCGLN